VRYPIDYILRDGNAAEIVKIIGEKVPLTTGYEQVMALSKVKEFAAELKGVASAATLNFDPTFLGIDLAAIPNFKVFGAAAGWTWANIGMILIPLLSSGSQIFSMWISRKLNDSLVTDENGVQDKETAKNSKANQSSKTMMIVMPLFSLWIGLTVPVALSLYWFVQGIVSTAVDAYLTKKYRTIYDAEDAERLKKAMELEAIEAEKERVRAERRAANPEGITQNTSKKKLQQKQQRDAEAAKAAAKKEYDAKKGNAVEEEAVENAPLSGIADRPYCKGRAYDPNRYASETTEE
jgi:YidC/Oxa1 family membrane protein insertase